MKKIQKNSRYILRKIVIASIVIAIGAYAIIHILGKFNLQTSQNIQTYTNTDFGVSFNYDLNLVTPDVGGGPDGINSKSVNYKILSGGNFEFDILENSTRMTPDFATELDEVKFKFALSNFDGDQTQYTQLKLDGMPAYKLRATLQSNGENQKCTFERIVTKKRWTLVSF